jgi:uncharacterized protein YbjT (DUF2867 family)
MSKTALILGATGLIGNLLLERLIKDDDYAQIKIFTRKSTGNTSPKVKEFVGDLLNLESFQDDFKGDVVFCCIGTTAKKTPDQILYKKIDFGIPVAAAKLAKQNAISTFLVVSAMGADSQSSIFYNRTKGEMEETVLTQAIENTYIVQPSLIVGDRNETRMGETIGNFVFNLINPLMLGALKKYRSIEADTIAKALIQLVKTTPKEHTFTSDKIQELGDNL